MGSLRSLSWMTVLCAGCAGGGPVSTVHHGIADASYHEVAPGLFVERQLTPDSASSTSWVEVEIPATRAMVSRAILAEVEPAGVPSNGQWVTVELPAANHGARQSLIERRGRIVELGPAHVVDVRNAGLVER